MSAAHAAHTLEYARSWERAARVPPRLWGWEALCQAPLLAAAPGRPLELPLGSEDGLLIRLCAPSVEERAGLLRFAQVQGGAPSAERPEEAFTGLCRALVQSAYAVDIADNGEQADRSLALGIYDLAILDIGLPRMSAPKMNAPSHCPLLRITPGTSVR